MVPGAVTGAGDNFMWVHHPTLPVENPPLPSSFDFGDEMGSHSFIVVKDAGPPSLAIIRYDGDAREAVLQVAFVDHRAEPLSCAHPVILLLALIGWAVLLEEKVVPAWSNWDPSGLGLGGKVAEVIMVRVFAKAAPEGSPSCRAELWAATGPVKAMPKTSVMEGKVGTSKS